MWVATNKSYISIVEHRNDKRLVVVRARTRNDLVAMFGRKHVILQNNDADYRYRVIVARDQAAAALVKAVDNIDYPNFKNSVKNPLRRKLYSEVWRVLLDLDTRYRTGVW